jgi:glycosyltransferase involved in cell wall biosynthesis
MNILVVSNYFPEHIGGEEIVAFNLVKNLRSMKHNVHWLAGKVHGIAHQPHPDDVEISIWNITESMFGFPYPLINPLAIRLLVQQVQWADVIHVHDSLFLINLLVGFFARRSGRPILLTQHVSVIPYQEEYKVWLQKAGYKVLARFLLERSDQVVCVSEVVKEWCDSNFHLKNSAMLIANGVDQKLFFPPVNGERERIRQSLGFREEQRVILFAGRFTEKKGIKIIKTAVEQTPELYWILIGRAGEENPGLWPFRNLSVLPPEPQQSLRKYYVAADMFALPSVGEGFPLVVQEAMMCGTPALISNETARAMPGLPVLTIDPDAEELIRAIRAAMLDLDRMNSLREEVALYACSHWNWETSARQYEQLMRTIVKKSVLRKLQVDHDLD